MSTKRKSEGSNSDDNDFAKHCSAILKFLEGKIEAEAFLEPVDWESLGIPDYPKIVKNPMDLGTVRERLDSGKYMNEEEFAADVRQVWLNAKAFNQPGSGIYSAADDLSKQFEKRLAKIKKSTGVPSKRKKSIGGSKAVASQDKVKFSTLINSLEPPQIGKVVEMIQQRSPDALNEEDEVDLEIEVDKIDKATLNALNVYCESCINADKKKK